MISNYEFIQYLAQHEWQFLHRGNRFADQKPVLLKTSAQTNRAIDSGKLLEQEFNLLQGLSIVGVPRAIELVDSSKGPFLVIEDEGGMPLQGFEPSHFLRLDSFFNIAVQLTTILAELHRRDIIHRNINPRGILVNPSTGEVSLVDLSLAIQAKDDSPGTLQPSLLNCILPYASPEQTGRMNRLVDYRSDFYSLGVTFYELLTGRLPFSSSDSLELIHCHLARAPAEPAVVDPEIPEPLSRIIMKLLEKTAEDRYQSALGLRSDLEICARQWEAARFITPFALGQRDVSDRFLIPQKLYGRERDVEQLLQAFERTCQGQTAMMLVAGYSGIGKTSLIQELYKPIVRRRGYFISGKFDQVARSTPFSALIEAFRSLVRQVLGESEERLAVWRVRLSQALGANGGVLTEAIPELELIVGKQPPLPVVPPIEALNRFQLVFQNFVGAFARPEHPLVVFLDDLQWADAATLSLLEPLLTSQEIQCLFLMGAYRDNEVDEGHPLMRALRAVEGAGGKPQSVTLGPLDLPDLQQLVGDTLHATPANVEPLTRLVWEKTGGNPFFVRQFLKTLKQEGLIEFDFAQGRWIFRLAAILDAPLTDNVIDLMTQKIQRLSAKTQGALTLASCIGNPFEAGTLAVVSEQTLDQVAGDLREALNEGLILPSTRNYHDREESSSSLASVGRTFTFLHDRVQQAAYALIPADLKQLVHLTVGRLLLEGSDLEQTKEKLFDVVHHLNLGSGQIADDAERLMLARLNLRAGQMAKSSTAYDAALGYLLKGSSLIGDGDWESDYDLAFALLLGVAECQNLCGDFAEAEQAHDLLLNRARSSLDKARVHSLRIIQYENLSRYADAIASAREALALFGVFFPDTEAEKLRALEAEIEIIRSSLGSREIKELIDLPVMSDPTIRMVMDILTTIWSSGYISGDQVLTRLISATMVRLSLVYGNSEESAYGYATHTITVGPVREDYKSAYEFGCLALSVNERFNDSRRRAKIYQQFHAHANLWRQPLQTCLAYAREATRSGFETGDFTYGVYGAYTETWVAMVITQDLERFVTDYTPNLALFKKLKVASIGDAQTVLLNWAKALQGKTIAPVSLSDDEFDENAYLETYRSNPFFKICYAVTKLHLCYVFGEYEKALEAARLGRGIVQHLLGTIWPVVFDFWNGLTLAASYASAEDHERKEYLEEIERARKSFAVLAENCPENYLCQSLLLSAELERISGRHSSALEIFAQAVQYAEERGMIQHQALAYELYARFQLERGQKRIAALFMVEAQTCYTRWGAAAKAEELQQRYPALFDHPARKSRELPSQPRVAAPEGRNQTESGTLDLISVIKAAQVIASELELNKLLEKLIRIAIENAGAQRGSLILEHQGESIVHAEGSVDSAVIRVHDAVPLEQAQHLSQSIVNYVRRTHENVVLEDAKTDDRYGNDPYILQYQPRSVMCLPILNQGRLIGTLYLENNIASGAFTPDRIQICQMLASQAAISLENAWLYDEMKEEAVHRTQAEETLRSIVEGTAAVTGSDFFASLVRHLAQALKVRYAFVTECRERAKTRARTLAFWMGDRLADNVTYEIAQTPCRKVLEGETCYYPVGVQQLFPNDHDLVDMRAVGYLGIPLCAASGSVIGHLAVIDDKPMPKTTAGLSLLNIFAARAGAELERQHVEDDLHQALAEVERLKNRLHAENVYLQEEIRREHNFEEIVGSSPALLEVLQQVERVAPTDATVLILGETGTGKELIARAIHNRSKRCDRPLVKVNCGAISAGLVESELFGHVKGAFTGALDKRTGRFELADGGTLFLDEVGELPLETQVKMLRVLQEGEFEPVGSSKTIKVNVRIIAASNRNLEDEIKAGRFRTDLFYRLNVLPLPSPPLRDRRTDIPQLAMFFLSRFSRRFGRPMDGISRDTIELMMNYHWPGNIRELQNLIERGVVLSTGTVLSLERSLLQGGNRENPNAPATELYQVRSASPSELSLEELQRDHILSVLTRTRWVIEGENGAARLLNLHPNTLRSRLKRMGIQRPKS